MRKLNNISLKIGLLLTIIIFSNNSQGQNTIEVQYQELKSAFLNYDTSYFKKLQNFEIVKIFENTKFRFDAHPRSLNVMFDFEKNHNFVASELFYKIHIDYFEIWFLVYDRKIDNVYYKVKITGAHPQIKLKKRGLAFFRIKKFIDCELVEKKFNDSIENIK